MPAKGHPERGFPLSTNEVKRFARNGPMYHFLEKYAFRDRVFQKFDFLEDTINLDFWALANSSGTSAADFAIQVLEDGVIRGDTGTTDDGAISMIGPLIYYGDRDAGMEIRLKCDAITDVHFEVGFIDAVPASNTGGVNDIDTPTFFAADCALVAADTDQTLKTMALCTVGSTANQDALKTNLGTLMLVANTYKTIRIQLYGNNVQCWVDGALQATHDTDPQGHFEGGVALAPWVYFRTRSTTAKFPDVDYIALWKDRNV